MNTNLVPINNRRSQEQNQVPLGNANQNEGSRNASALGSQSQVSKPRTRDDATPGISNGAPILGPSRQERQIQARENRAIDGGNVVSHKSMNDYSYGLVETEPALKDRLDQMLVSENESSYMQPKIIPLSSDKCDSAGAPLKKFIASQNSAQNSEDMGTQRQPQQRDPKAIERQRLSKMNEPVVILQRTAPPKPQPTQLKMTNYEAPAELQQQKQGTKFSNPFEGSARRASEHSSHKDQLPPTRTSPRKDGAVNNYNRQHLKSQQQSHNQSIRQSSQSQARGSVSKEKTSIIMGHQNHNSLDQQELLRKYVNQVQGPRGSQVVREQVSIATHQSSLKNRQYVGLSKHNKPVASIKQAVTPSRTQRSMTPGLQLVVQNDKNNVKIPNNNNEVMLSNNTMMSNTSLVKQPSLDADLQNMTRYRKELLKNSKGKKDRGPLILNVEGSSPRAQGRMREIQDSLVKYESLEGQPNLEKRAKDMFDDQVDGKKEVWEASGKPEVMDSALPLSEDYLESAQKIKNIFVVRKKSYNNSRFEPVDQQDNMEGDPLDTSLNETGETSRKDPNSHITGGPIFNLHNTRQSLKFYPAVTMRTKQKDFEINTSGIPKINQSSRAMIQNKLKYITEKNNIEKKNVLQNSITATDRSSPLAHKFPKKIDPKLALQDQIRQFREIQKADPHVRTQSLQILPRRMEQDIEEVVDIPYKDLTKMFSLKMSQTNPRQSQKIINYNTKNPAISQQNIKAEVNNKDNSESMADLVRSFEKRNSIHSEMQALKGTERLKFNRFRQSMGKIQKGMISKYAGKNIQILKQFGNAQGGYTKEQKECLEYLQGLRSGPTSPVVPDNKGGIDRKKYLEFVAQSHQNISSFVYPSKLSTDLGQSVKNLGLQRKSVVSSPREASQRIKGLDDKEIYRQVVQEINDRAKVKIFKKNEPLPFPRGPNDPDLTRISQGLVSDIFKLSDRGRNSVDMSMVSRQIGTASTNTTFPQFRPFEKRGQSSQVQNRTYIVDQIQKKKSNMIGDRVFKTSHQQGNDYLERDCQVTKMHDDLRKLKWIQKNRTREMNRFRYAYEDDPPCDDLRDQLRSMFQVGEIEMSQDDELSQADGMKNKTNGFDIVGSMPTDLNRQQQRSRGGARTAMDASGRKQNFDQQELMQKQNESNNVKVIMPQMQPEGFEDMPSQSLTSGDPLSPKGPQVETRVKIPKTAQTSPQVPNAQSYNKPNTPDNSQPSSPRRSKSFAKKGTKRSLKIKPNVEYRADSLRMMIENFHSDTEVNKEQNSHRSQTISPPHITSPTELSPTKAKEPSVERQYGEKELLLAILTSVERSQMNHRKKKDFKDALHEMKTDMDNNNVLEGSEADFYAKMRKIMNKPREKLSILDKQQMFEIIDKTKNSIHKIDIAEECKQEMERLGFDSYLQRTHQYIKERRGKILEHQRSRHKQQMKSISLR